MSMLIRHGVLLMGALGVLIARRACADLPEKEWWESTLVYQIWPRGFQDSDGNGEGDLKGIISRLDYIEELGAETIWLNPIYSSPLIDSGYDIANYTDIDPLFGTLQHFDELVEEAHKRDIKIILDIVPNHSSDRHDWFLLSAQSIDPYTDYYVWSNGTVDEDGNEVPPNNWISTYSEDEGSAWTWHDLRRQWYYHKFHASQPDLNLRNENVLQELVAVFDFWLRRNVDGFRINAIPYFFEDEDLRNEPVAGNTSYTFGLLESTALLYAFREYIDDWVEANNATSKLLIAESYDSDDNLMMYYGNGTRKGIPPFNFRFITHVRNNSDANYIKAVLEEWLRLLPENTSTNWVLSNHDHPRATSRIGLNRVDGLHMLNLLLPGQAYIYYGEEIEMEDAKIPLKRTIDPMGYTRSEDAYERFSRDPARTPMQWNSGTSAGFSTNETTYLPVHPNYIDRNVEEQEGGKRSHLKTYKLLSALRKEPVFTHGDYDFGTLNDDNVLVLRRFLENHPVYLVIVNLGTEEERVNLTSLYSNLKDTLEIVVSSSDTVPISDNVSRDNFTLSTNAAIVLKGEEEDGTCEPATISGTTDSSASTVAPTEETAEGGASTVETTSAEPDISTDASNSTDAEKTSVSEATETTTPMTVSPIETTVQTDTKDAINNAVVNSVSVMQVVIKSKLTVHTSVRLFFDETNEPKTSVLRREKDWRFEIKSALIIPSKIRRTVLWTARNTLAAVERRRRPGKNVSHAETRKGQSGRS
ncbi:hypothetical protein KM043_000607 [Ampulex compressa]|nr:hypothetical protein KM043_000607 [Ampulex compressa]